MATLSTTFVIEDEQESDTTYQIINSKIQGTISGVGALRQSILKLLSVQQYECEIYGFDYGIDLNSLIGKDRAYAETESKRRIQESILRDNRVESVENFSFTYDGDSMYIQFDVKSIYGTLTMNTEVAN